MNKNGYLVLKKFLNKSEKKLIVKVFFKTLSKYLRIDKKFYNSNINNAVLHNKLINFRKKNPKKFGNFYDELKLNSSLRSIFYSRKFIKIFSKILNTREEYLFINGFVLRLDAPYDKRNILDWHHDASYYHQTYPSYNAAFCLVPITDNSVKNGTVKFVPKSHKLKINHRKFIDYKYSQKSQMSATNYNISIRKNEKKLIKDFEVSFGDIGLFHILLKHRSGTNVSKKFRLTFMCRIHDTSKSFNVGKEEYIFNKTNSAFFNKKLVSK